MVLYFWGPEKLWEVGRKYDFEIKEPQKLRNPWEALNMTFGDTLYRIKLKDDSISVLSKTNLHDDLRKMTFTVCESQMIPLLETYFGDDVKIKKLFEAVKTIDGFWDDREIGLAAGDLHIAVERSLVAKFYKDGFMSGTLTEYLNKSKVHQASRVVMCLGTGGYVVSTFLEAYNLSTDSIKKNIREQFDAMTDGI